MSWIRLILHEVKLDLRHGGLIRSAPIIIIGVTLFVLGMFLVVTVNLRKGIQTAQGKVEMVVFLTEEGAAVADSLEASLAALAGIRSIRYVSREEALESFREDLGEKIGLLEAVESSPLPASYELAIYDDFKSEERLARIATEIGVLPGVEGVRYGQEWVGRLQRLIVFSIFVDVFLGVLLGISTILSVANTLRLALEQRRQSIEVMRLVGASDGVIRGPVFIEGALLGALAAAISIFGLFLCYRFLAGRVPELIFMGPKSLTLFVLTGGILGGLGSLVALGRILKDPSLA